MKYVIYIYRADSVIRIIKYFISALSRD